MTADLKVLVVSSTTLVAVGRMSLVAIAVKETAVIDEEAASAAASARCSLRQCKLVCIIYVKGGAERSEGNEGGKAPHSAQCGRKSFAGEKK